MKKPYIFWDFDGTLLNTDGIIIDSWNATAMHFIEKTIDTDVILKTFGETIRYTCGKFFPEVPAEEAMEFYRAYQRENFKGKLKLFDGVEALVDKLNEQGYRNCIVTSRLKGTTYQYLDEMNIRDKFDVVITADDVSAHKPDPEPLSKAIELLSQKLNQEIKLDDCVMIGDSKFDVGCANNLGVTSVIVDWGHGINEEGIREMGFKYDYVIKDPEDLLKIV